MITTDGSGWVYCLHCDCLTSVFSEEWGTLIECTVCDKSFIAEKGD